MIGTELMTSAVPLPVRRRANRGEPNCRDAFRAPAPNQETST
jgi:hypothetical protein